MSELKQKQKHASMKWIRKKLSKLPRLPGDRLGFVLVKQINDKTVNFLFESDLSMFGFSTGLRNAKKLLQEIEVTKILIKRIEVNFEY